MTVVALTTIHPRPGTAWDEVQKQLKRACDLARKHGAENVTVLATMIFGSATNTIGVLCSTEDLTRYAKVQHALMDDPETQALLVEASQTATWETYFSQTIPDVLALWVSLTLTSRPPDLVRSGSAAEPANVAAVAEASLSAATTAERPGCGAAFKGSVPVAAFQGPAAASLSAQTPLDAGVGDRFVLVDDAVAVDEDGGQVA